MSANGISVYLSWPCGHATLNGYMEMEGRKEGWKGEWVLLYLYLLKCVSTLHFINPFSKHVMATAHAYLSSFYEIIYVHLNYISEAD